MVKIDCCGIWWRVASRKGGHQSLRHFGEGDSKSTEEATTVCENAFLGFARNVHVHVQHWGLKLSIRRVGKLTGFPGIVSRDGSL